jgi:hypothetical protein
LERQPTSTRLYGAIFQKADMFIIAAMRTGNVKPIDVLNTHDLDNGGSRHLRLDIPENCHLQHSFFIDSFFLVVNLNAY